MLSSKYLILNKLDKAGWYELGEDFSIVVGTALITAPKGMKTDLASVPLIFRPLFPKDGEYTPSAVIHDFLYSELNTTGINREWADRIFLELMKQLKVPLLTRYSMYRAVRIFGSASWKAKTGYVKQAIIDCTEEAKEYNLKMKRILQI